MGTLLFNNTKSTTKTKPVFFNTTTLLKLYLGMSVFMCLLQHSHVGPMQAWHLECVASQRQNKQGVIDVGEVLYKNSL